MIIRSRRREQREAPLFDAVRSHLRKRYRSLHVPLHGGGAGAPDLQKGGFYGALRWDLTEVGALDDLHLPQGAIGQAQELAAALFGAETTFFLVNGVTGGLLSLFPAICRPGEKVLLTRLAHKAALHGVALSGARPVYLPVERERRSGFPLNVSADTVAGALQQHPEARLLLVTSPSYWGVTADLSALRQITARHGVVLAVDEAHGTHLSFYRQKLPHGAAAGADIWLQSAHKSLGSLTPGAFLHLGPGALTFAPTIRFWLQALQTSSPSYPLLVSLDLARRQAALKGGTLFSAAWRWAERLRERLVRSGFTLLTTGRGSEFKPDPCRVTILCHRGSGEALARRLAQKYRWQVEMSGRSYLLAIVGPAHLSFSPYKLARALRGAGAGCGYFNPVVNGEHHAAANIIEDFSGEHYAAANIIEDFPPSFFRLENVLFGEQSKIKTEEEVFPIFPLAPAEALRRPSLNISLQAALGKICAETIVLSPPGIPLLAPGEKIRAAVLEHILKQQAAGRLFQGAADPALHTIKVVREEASVVE